MPTDKIRMKVRCEFPLDVAVDMKAVSARRQELRAAGVPKAVLDEIERAAATKDGFSRAARREQLCALVSRSGAAGEALLGAFTAAGRQTERLDTETFVRAHGAGSFRLADLSVEEWCELKLLGVDTKALERIASRDQQISNKFELSALFYAIDRVDSDGSGASVELSLSGVASKAGRAMEILRGVHRPFDVLPKALAEMAFVKVAKEEQCPTRIAIKPQKQIHQTDCFDCAKRMIPAKLRAQLSDISHFSARVENDNGHIGGFASDFKDLRSYLDACLDKGLPGLVGVSHSARWKTPSWDQITDHFVLVTKRDYDEDGALYYEFNDPASGKTDRFYVDAESGMLVKSGELDTKEDRKNGGWVRQYSYRATSIKTYEGDVSFESLMGKAPSPSASFYDIDGISPIAGAIENRVAAEKV